jgi:hypothetical protein
MNGFEISNFQLPLLIPRTANKITTIGNQGKSNPQGINPVSLPSQRRPKIKTIVQKIGNDCLAIIIPVKRS